MKNSNKQVVIIDYGLGNLFSVNQACQKVGLNVKISNLKEEIKKHNIPYNILHDRGFVSIGCQPCTRAIREGEDFRAGRWWWENNDKKECGLHA